MAKSHGEVQKSHPTLDRVLKNYQAIKDKFTDSNTQEVKYTIFPAFYVMLHKLREMNIPFTIILRTFGRDLSETIKEIGEHPLGVKIIQRAKFKDGHLLIKALHTKEKRTIEKVEEVFETFLSLGNHFAVRDDWNKWNQDGERGRSGKPFIYDMSERRIIKNLSLFFDDNITGEERDIVHPYEISGTDVATKTLCGKLLYPVDTIKAMLNDNYFIDRVLQAINASWRAFLSKELLSS